MRCLVAAGLLIAAVGFAGPATAAYETDDFFTGALVATVSLDADGLGWAVGLRASWTRVSAPVPLGADVEVSYLFTRAQLRAAGTAHVLPMAALSGDACRRRVATRQRDEQLLFGPSVALAAGPVLQVGVGAPDWGAQLGALLSGAVFTAHARGLWLADAGPVVELGGGVRVPSILGFDDVALFCP